MRELSLHIMDIVQNSLSAGASVVKIDILEDSTINLMEISISDNGTGMTPGDLKEACDPFYTTKAGNVTGMGLSLFKMSAEQTGGSFEITSKKGTGTLIRAQYFTSHIDMKPLGDINETISLLITCNPGVDFIYSHKGTNNSVELDTIELKQRYGVEALTGLGTYPLVLSLLGQNDNKRE